MVCDGISSRKGSHSIFLFKLKSSGKIGYGSNRWYYVAKVDHDGGTMHLRHADKRWIKGWDSIGLLISDQSSHRTIMVFEKAPQGFELLIVQCHRYKACQKREMVAGRGLRLTGFLRAFTVAWTHMRFTEPDNYSWWHVSPIGNDAKDGLTGPTLCGGVWSRLLLWSWLENAILVGAFIDSNTLSLLPK
jgi:hypothetical protein